MLQEFFRKIRDRLTEWWEKIDKKDRVRFLLVTAVSVVVIIVAVTLLNRTQYAVLYRDMDPGEAGEVMAILREEGVKTRTEGAGTILVPADQVDRLSMDLASRGHPRTGYTYDTLSRGAGFGTTEAERRIYARLDLQERLATTLRQFAPSIVKDAHVEIAEQDATTPLLQSQVMPATASVMLTIVSELSEENIKAVEYLVAAAVEGLDPENVYITDQYLRRLNHADKQGLLSADTDYEKASAVRDDFMRGILQLLIPIFGSDNVRVSGQVILDFDERAVESVVFAPVVDDEGIDISIREIRETAMGQQSAGNVGIDPNGAAPVYPETEGDLSEYSSYTREINREVSETRENIVKAKGKITDLSFSVAINSDNLSDENRSADAVKNLVANVVGLSPGEYDRISVEFRKFDGLIASREMQANADSARRTEQLLNFFKVLGLYLIIGICVLLIIIRLFKLFGKREEELASEAALETLETLELGETEAHAQAVSQEDAEYGELVKLATGPGGEEITISKKDSRHRVEEFIDKNPDAVANLLRNWLSDEKSGMAARKR